MNTDQIFTYKNLNYEGNSLAYLTAGAGEPFVLLHGYLASSLIWKDIISRLIIMKYKVIAVDLPGHGNSDTWPPVHTMEFMADCVMVILKQEGIQNCCIVGHSLGGYIALAFGEKYSDYVNSMILLNSDPFADSAKKKGKRDREINLIYAGKKELIVSLSKSDINSLVSSPDELFGQILTKDKMAMIATIEGMKMRPERTEMLERNKFPVLFIAGRKDLHTNLPKLNKALEENDKVKILILENGIHYAFLEEPEFIVQQMIGFYSNNKI